VAGEGRRERPEEGAHLGIAGPILGYRMRQLVSMVITMKVDECAFELQVPLRSMQQISGLI
jgi:hypothetical protein